MIKSIPEWFYLVGMIAILLGLVHIHPGLAMVFLGCLMVGLYVTRDLP